MSQVSLLFLFFVLHMSVQASDNETAYEHSGISEYEDEMPECNSATIYCMCGIRESVSYIPTELKAFRTIDPSNGKPVCSGYADPYQECAKISCSFAPKNILPPENENTFLSDSYPKVFTIEAGENSSGHRFARDSNPCPVRRLKTAAVTCYGWPNWINCDIKCIYGYAHRVGEKALQSTSINCRLSEKKWKPYGFHECEPYLNCKVRLVSPGYMKCKRPDTTGPMYCDISCEDYQDYEATDIQRFACIDESFGDNLPHCAVLDNSKNGERAIRHWGV